MTDMTLAEAIAEVKPHSNWNGAHFLPTLFRTEIRDAIATILNAVLSGDLIPHADAELAVVEVQRLREERDAALARLEKLRHQITEASDPDFIWGALDNVHDMDVTLDDYAAAVSRAIRAALGEDLTDASF